MAGESLCEQAYNYIFEQITKYHFKPNDPIIESEIGKELNISRTPLREALRRLEADGLVYKIRNRGTYVRSFSSEDVVEICEIRSVFELYALRRCVERVTSQELQTLRDELNALDVNSSPDKYYNCDVKLHKMIMSFCMNSRMLSILNTLNLQLELFRRISASMPHRLEKSKEEHLQIIDALAAKDYARSHALLTLHLENVKDNTVKAFQKLKYKYTSEL